VFLLVLLISKFFANRKEGFILFEKDKNTLASLIIGDYSTTKQVLKMYDNLYLDKSNYNLIEVNGTEESDANKESDNTGTTITQIYIVPPCSSSVCAATSYTHPNTDYAQSLKPMPTLSAPWSYETQSATSTKYQVFFIPIPSINTVVSYTVDLKAFKSVIALKITDTVEDTFFQSDPSFSGLGVAVPYTDANDGKMIVETLYDPSMNVYQINKFVKYDFNSKNLLVKPSDTSALSIYDQSKNVSVSSETATAGSHTVANPVYNALSLWTLVDPANNLILFVPVSSDYTMIIVLNKTNTNLVLTNALVFQKDVGLISSNGVAITTASPSPTTSTTTSASPSASLTPSPTESQSPTTSASLTATSLTPTTIAPTTSASPTTASPTTASLTPLNPIASYYNKHCASDFMLKSEMIPPVSCPNCICSSCNSSGNSGSTNNHSCGSCGGSTNGVAVNTFASATETPAIRANLPPVAVQTDLSNNPILNNTRVGAGNLIGGVLTGAGNLGSGVLTGAGNLGGGLMTGVGNLGGGVLTGAGNLGGGLMTGVGNLVASNPYNVSNTNYSGYSATTGGQAASSVQSTGEQGMVSEASRQRVNNQRNQYYQSPSVQSQPSNLTSQYGSQSSSSSVFLPLTSDFSRFSK